MIDGLTVSEIEAVRDHFGADQIQTGQAETGAAYAVAFIGQDEDGQITQTVFRERGVVAALDRSGAVVATGASLEEVLVGL